MATNDSTSERRINLTQKEFDKFKNELEAQVLDQNVKTHTAADVRREVEVAVKEAVEKALTEERQKAAACAKRKFEEPETENEDLKKKLKKLKDGMRKISEIAGQHL